MRLPDVVGVCLKYFDFVHGVVVIHSNKHVVRSRQDPLLACDELGSADRQLCHLEGLDERLKGSEGSVRMGNAVRVWSRVTWSTVFHM